MKKKLQWLNIIELLKFCIGGGSAVLVDFISYLMLKSILNLSVAKAFSYILGAMIGFIINKFWTFQCKEFKLIEVLKYIVLYICSAAANTLVNKIVIIAFSNIVFAFLCATGTSTIINFMGQKFFVFKKNYKKE